MLGAPGLPRVHSHSPHALTLHTHTRSPSHIAHYTHTLSVSENAAVRCEVDQRVHDLDFTRTFVDAWTGQDSYKTDSGGHDCDFAYFLIGRPCDLGANGDGAPPQAHINHP